MIKNILLTIALLVIVFVIFVATRPSEFHVERSATFSATPAAVFAQINDFHHWQDWSPWAKLDPAATATYSGPAAGTGAVFAWAGNNNVGEGRMTITDSRPNESVVIKLEFLKPFEQSAISQFALKPEGNQTLVTWSMSGHNNFVGRLFCLFADMDKMVGGDYERGLANIKSIVETSAKK